MAQGFGKDIQVRSDRVSQLKRKIRNMYNSDDIMLSILEVFTESELIPEVGNYYTFVYMAKTPKIIYDQYPLIAVTSIERWGFRGFNYHWNKFRNYTWREVIGKMHVIRANEIEYLRILPYAKFIAK
jgi:hypothetical protein